MALNNDDQRRIREYLLGILTEDEQHKIEERLMLEDDLLEELEISKGELVEEYCAAELSREEHQWFEQHYLASPEGRQRYALALTLDRSELPALEPSPRPTFFEQFQTLLTQRPWLVATVAAAATFLIVAAIFLSRSTDQTVVGPTLASNIINREQGSLPSRITIPSNAKEIKFRLLIPRDSLPTSKYRAELDNKTEVKPVEVLEYDREGVWVVVPVAQLPHGEYSLKLVAISAEGTEREIPGDYLFNVE